MKKEPLNPLHGYPCRHCGGAAGRTALRSVQQEAYLGSSACKRKHFYGFTTVRLKSLA